MQPVKTIAPIYNFSMPSSTPTMMATSEAASRAYINFFIDKLTFSVGSYFRYSAQSVRRMSPLRRKVSCMPKAAERAWWVCPPNFSACFK